MFEEVMRARDYKKSSAPLVGTFETYERTGFSGGGSLLTFYIAVFTDKGQGHEGRYLFHFEAWGTAWGKHFKIGFSDPIETIEGLMADLSVLEDLSLEAFRAMHMQKFILGL